MCFTLTGILDAFACPDNVFFIKPSQWIWTLVAWQLFQILVLFSQDRFGSGFFLPKSVSHLAIAPFVVIDRIQPVIYDSFK